MIMLAELKYYFTKVYVEETDKILSCLPKFKGVVTCIFFENVIIAQINC